MYDKIEDFIRLLKKLKISLEKYSDATICIQIQLEYNWKGKLRYILIELKLFFYNMHDNIEDYIG